MGMINLVYLVKVAITFSLLYNGCYWLTSKNTFHKLNRALLLSIIVLSVFIPLLKIPGQWSSVIGSSIPFKFSTFSDFDTAEVNENVKKNVWHINWLMVIKSIYLIVVILLFIKPARQLLQFLKIKKSYPNQKNDLFTIIKTSNTYPPFSFFYWLFIPEHLSTMEKNNPIIEHEKVHAKQLHSLDLLLTELFSIFLWFVPFVYSFKRSIKNVHEYIADSYLIETIDDKKSYLQLLADETEKYILIGLSSNFYCKTLKKRITMITKNKSKRSLKLSYLVLLPLLALLFYAFNTNKVANADALSSKVTLKQEPSGSPIKGDYEITSAFGMRMHPIKNTMMMHNGIDIKADSGTPVISTAEGTVIKSEFLKDTYGEVIVIQHDQIYTTLYAQLSERSVMVGDKVNKGQIIGYVGSSGMSTGPHLHYEVISKGKNVNPADYLN